MSDLENTTSAVALTSEPRALTNNAPTTAETAALAKAKPAARKPASKSNVVPLKLTPPTLPANYASLGARAQLKAQQTLNAANRVYTRALAERAKSEAPARGARSEGGIVALAKLILANPGKAANKDTILPLVRKAKIVSSKADADGVYQPVSDSSPGIVSNDFSRYLPIFIEAKFGLAEMKSWLAAFNSAPRIK